MTPASLRRLCLTALLALVALPATAQLNNPLLFGPLIAEQSRPSFSLMGAGARAAGMGGAFTALADDASAASFNPAGLALLTAPEVSFVGTGIRHREDLYGFASFPGRDVVWYDDTNFDFDMQDLTFGAFTLPLEVSGRNFCLQLSYQRQVDFNFESDRFFNEWSSTDEKNAKYTQLVRQDGDIHTFSVAAAYQLTQRLSLGTSLSRWEGSWEFGTVNWARPVDLDYDIGFRYLQRNRLEGWNWNVGALLRYRYLNVGGMYRLPFDATYSFGSAFAATNLDTDFQPEPRLRRPLHWPSSWTLGIAVKPTQTWVVTADYARYNWSQMEIRDLGDDRDIALNFFDMEPSGWSKTVDVGHWRFGTEYSFFLGRTLLSLRGGYFREDQPIKNLTLTGSEEANPRRRDNRVDGYSVGLGTMIGPVAFDIAYQRREKTDLVAQFVDPRVLVNDSWELLAFGWKDTVEERVFASLLYRFPAGRGVKNALRFLFVGPSEPDTPGDER